MQNATTPQFNKQNQIKQLWGEPLSPMLEDTAMTKVESRRSTEPTSELEATTEFQAPQKKKHKHGKHGNTGEAT
jgi:hypothetical protein